LNPVGTQQAQLVGDKRLPIHLDQGFGDGLRQRPQPHRQASRQNRYRQQPAAHDWATTFVPSKSKRKRTSCKPASRMARRRRTLSSAQKIKKPPPPAPISLPPNAPLSRANWYHWSTWLLLMQAERCFLYSQ